MVSKYMARSKRSILASARRRYLLAFRRRYIRWRFRFGSCQQLVFACMRVFFCKVVCGYIYKAGAGETRSHCRIDRRILFHCTRFPLSADSLGQCRQQFDCDDAGGVVNGMLVQKLQLHGCLSGDLLGWLFTYLHIGPSKQRNCRDIAYAHNHSELGASTLVAVQVCSLDHACHDEWAGIRISGAATPSYCGSIAGISVRIQLEHIAQRGLTVGLFF